MKRGLFLIFVFLLGAVIGFCSSSFLWPESRTLLKKAIVARLGQVLDEDSLTLRSGQILRGKVITQDDEGILFQIPKGSVFFSAEEVQDVKYNIHARYFKEAW